MCRDLEYKLGPGAENSFLTYVQKRMEMPFFANARTVRNAIDLARMRAAVRLFGEKMEKSSDGISLPRSIYLPIRRRIVPFSSG